MNQHTGHLQNILIGVTGGIAAYKTPEIIRRLRDAGCDVRVVMTEAAKAFITPLTLQAISGNPVYSEHFDLDFESAMGHIELARWADAICVAPATADFLARLAAGRADDLLTTLCLASVAPIFVAPAMNQHMWHAEVTQTNIQILQSRGVICLGPDSGSQACGDYGLGRMLSPESIARALLPLQVFAGRTVLVTAGPTREKIDPIRYLSNYSSGKMGFALANAARCMGAKVVLVAGPSQQQALSGVVRIDVESAADMHQAVMAHIESSHLFIAAAAVADYRVLHASNQKIKKSTNIINLQLSANIDILAEVAALSPRPFCCGFAAETEDLLANAKQKMLKKKIDMIVANRVAQADNMGFDADDNQVTLLYGDKLLTLPKQNKTQLAYQILSVIAKTIQTQGEAHDTEKHSIKNPR